MSFTTLTKLSSSWTLSLLFSPCTAWQQLFSPPELPVPVPSSRVHKLFVPSRVPEEALCSARLVFSPTSSTFGTLGQPAPAPLRFYSWKRSGLPGLLYLYTGFLWFHTKTSLNRKAFVLLLWIFWNCRYKNERRLGTANIFNLKSRYEEILIQLWKFTLNK